MSLRDRLRRRFLKKSATEDPHLNSQLDQIIDRLADVKIEARRLFGKTEQLSTEVRNVRLELQDMRRDYAPIVAAVTDRDLDRMYRPKDADDTDFGS